VSFIMFYCLLAAGVLFILNIPEIMPKCSCCKKIKVRFLMGIHQAVTINPGYSGNRSVCKKCCKKYNIRSIKDLEQLQDIQKKIKTKNLVNDPLD
jgi:hypothetical protein